MQAKEHMLFIILFLHQTTTRTYSSICLLRLFIILFLHQTTTKTRHALFAYQLFIILFLHQTTTYGVGNIKYHELFIILFLHQTTTSKVLARSAIMLFIILFLHQTTTEVVYVLCVNCCLSSCSYIKPQPLDTTRFQSTVVYHLVPTSNHNIQKLILDNMLLFIILFLHQTTTARNVRCSADGCLSSCSYIKPQRQFQAQFKGPSCLSSCSYIKPQPSPFSPFLTVSCLSSCSYIKPQHPSCSFERQYVVYHLVPTSNHNPPSAAPE